MKLQNDYLKWDFIVVTHGHLEEAASLSEKYFEFNALVKICEIKNDMERLDVYMDQFAEQVNNGFQIF